MSRTVEHYTAQAQQAFEAGFTTKSAQTGALEDLSRAYDLIKDDLRKALLTEAEAKWPNARGNEADWRERTEWLEEQGYWAVPDYLHNVRDQHASLLKGRGFEVEALVKLRAAIKAAPVVKGPPKPTQQQIEDALKMTCQCCGRRIHANTGQIAHHGYERPGWGWQTASCEGARELPFEASRDALGTYIERLKERKLVLANSLAHVDDDGRELSCVITDYDTHGRFGRSSKMLVFTATAETFEAKRAEHPVSARHCGVNTWEALKERVRSQLQASLTSISSELRDQQARYDGWTQTHQWVASWQPIEEIK